MRGKGVKEKIKAAFGLGIKVLAASVITLLLLECGVRAVLSVSLNSYLTKTLAQPYGRIMRGVGGGLNHLLSINRFDPLCGYIPRQGFFRGDENVGIIKSQLLNSLKRHRPSDETIIQKLGMGSGSLETASEKQLEKALNNALEMPDLHIIVASQIDRSKLPAGIQTLLGMAQASQNSLSERDTRRLNRALLEHIYPAEILLVPDNPVRVDCPKKKEEHEIRAICIGDSTTYGFAVGYRDSWVYLLGKALAEKYPEKKIRVLNAGVPGATSRQTKRIFQFYLVAYHPDILIWRGGSALTDTYFVNVATDAAIFFLWRCLYESRLFRVLCVFLDKDNKWLINHVYDLLTQRAPRSRKPSKEFDSDFSMVKRIAQESGTKYVLQVERLICDDKGVIRGELKDAGRGGDKDAVHTQAVFKEYIEKNPSKDLFVDAVHLTETGEALTAEEISKFIINRKWIETFD